MAVEFELVKNIIFKNDDLCIIKLNDKRNIMVTTSGEFRVGFRRKDNTFTWTERRSFYKDRHHVTMVNIHGNSESLYIHRLIAAVWLGMKHGEEVHHLNSVRSNNKLHNLSVCTRAEHQELESFIAYMRRTENTHKGLDNYATASDIRYLNSLGYSMDVVRRSHNWRKLICNMVDILNDLHKSVDTNSNREVS